MRQHRTTAGVAAVTLGVALLWLPASASSTVGSAGTASVAQAPARAVAAAPAVRQHDFPPASGDPAIIRPGTRLRTLFEGACALTTGPAADQYGDVYFAELSLRKVCLDEDGNPEAGVIYRYRSDNGRTRVWRSPSGQANGMDFDAEGRLVVAESADNGGQRVTRTDMQTRKSVILANEYDGRPLLAPNGVSIDEEGRIYFTDPRYEGLEPVEQPVQGIYRIDPDRSVHRIIVNASKPNGVLVSPDQQTLYVANFDVGFLDGPRLTEEELATIPPLDMALYAYPLHEDGTVGERETLVDYLPRFGPDGLTADSDGNIYVAVRDTDDPAIVVYQPDGTEIARIPTGDILPTAAEFGTGPDSDLLYVTAGKGLYRIRLNSEGYQLP